MKSLRPFRAAALTLVLTLALCQSVLAATVSVKRGPYLETGSSTSVTVKWRTDVATDSCVRYGTSLSSLTSQTCASTSSSSQSGPYYDIFTLPKSGEAGGVASGTEAYYSFNYGNIHFVCLDSTDSNRSPSGAMLTWLKADLSANTRQWLIAYWHHPPYSKGSHDSDSESELEQMRQYANPILEGYGVDLVLSGHSHSYERSYLLDGHYGDSSTLTSSMIKDSGNGREDGSGAYGKPVGLASHKGAVYTVAGSSGHTGGGSLNHPAMYISLNVLGSLVLDVNGSRLDAKFLNSSGSTQDHFTIKKDLGTSTFDFSLTNGGSKSVTQGASVSNTLSATLVSGTTQSVSFSASGLPTGASASFSSTTCSPTCSTTVTIKTSSTTPIA